MKFANVTGILALIIGLPSFIVACTLADYRGYAILAIIIAAGLYISYRLLTLPPWTILDMHRKIEIKRRDGSLAKITKITKIRANHKGLTEFAHRNIRADGSVGNFKLGSKSVTSNNIEIMAGEYIVYERFRPVGWWKTRESRLSYHLTDSYPESTESTTHAPDYYTQKCTIEVHLPRGRRVTSVRAYRGLGAEVVELKCPTLSDDNHIICWEGKRLRPGKRYTVEWTW